MDGNASHRERLHERGLCRSCEMPLLDEELAADARYCGVCRAVRARARAMKRSPETSPQEVNAYLRAPHRGGAGQEARRGAARGRACFARPRARPPQAREGSGDAPGAVSARTGAIAHGPPEGGPGGPCASCGADRAHTDAHGGEHQGLAAMLDSGSARGRPH